MMVVVVTDLYVCRYRWFSRPAEPLVRLGSPVGRFAQVRSTKKYLLGVRESSCPT